MSDANPKEEVRTRPDRRKEEWTSPRAYPWREHATDDGFKLVLYGDSVWLMDDSCCNVQAAINCKLFTKPQLSGGGVITAVYCGVAHFAVEAGTAGEWSQKLGWDWTRWIREWEGSSGSISLQLQGILFGVWQCSNIFNSVCCILVWWRKGMIW